MKKTLLNILKYVILIAFTIISICLIYYIEKLNILKLAYFIVACVLVSLIWLLVTIKLLSKKSKTISKIVVAALAVIFFSIDLIAVKYIDNTINFVDNVTKSEYTVQKYCVLVLNSSNYEKIEDLKNKKIGFIATNINLDKTKAKLSKQIKYSDKMYEDVASLISGIYDYNVQAIVLDESYIELLEENNVSFLSESKEIYTFEVRVKKKDTRKEVNINEEPFILYISGSDSRGSVSDIARSDVNIVAVVNPKTNKILLVSIPRDYYVQLHETYGTKDKLTHAGIYGIEMSKTTIEDLLSININYYAKVSFTTVINVVDVIDGIDVYSDQDLKLGNCVIPEGVQHLNGTCALAFSRERHSYLTGDRHRGQNQQAVITAIINKLSNPKYLVKYNDILNAIDGSFETDLTYEEITNIVKYQSSELKNWTVESISLDGTGAMLPTYSMGSQNLYVMIPDESTVEYAKTKINEYLGN